MASKNLNQYAGLSFSALPELKTLSENIPELSNSNLMRTFMNNGRDLENNNNLLMSHRKSSSNTKLSQTSAAGVDSVSINPEGVVSALEEMQKDIEKMKRDIEVKKDVYKMVTQLVVRSNISQSTPNISEIPATYSPEHQTILNREFAGSKNSLHVMFPEISESAHMPQGLMTQANDSETKLSNGGYMVSQKSMARYKLENAENNLKYKTSICRHFEKKGHCPLQENCQFAHGNTELRQIREHRLYKTRLCRLHVEGKSCPYGDKCYYYHSEDEMNAALLERRYTSQPHLDQSRQKSPITFDDMEQQQRGVMSKVVIKRPGLPKIFAQPSLNNNPTAVQQREVSSSVDSINRSGSILRQQSYFARSNEYLMGSRTPKSNNNTQNFGIDDWAEQQLKKVEELDMSAESKRRFGDVSLQLSNNNNNFL